MIHWETMSVAWLLFASGCASLIIKAWVRYGLTYISYPALYLWLLSLGMIAVDLNHPQYLVPFALCLLLMLCCAVMLYLKLRDYFRAHWRFFSHTPESLR